MRVIKYDLPEALKPILTAGLISKIPSFTAAGMKLFFECLKWWTTNVNGFVLKTSVLCQ